MRLTLSVVGFVALFGGERSGVAADLSVAQARLAEGYGEVPLSFEPNRGQTSGKVQWVARGPEYALFLTGHDAVLELNSITPAKGITDRPKIDSAAVRMNLLGANAVKAAAGEEPQPGKANYFTGNDESKWQREVPTFGKVRLREVYPGIDLVYYGKQGRLEYDFVVAPGADPGKIRLGFDGATARMAENGDLVLPVDGTKAEVRFDKPVVYQMKDGNRETIAGEFLIAENRQVSFKLGEYDTSRELVIDPTLLYLGALGTGSSETIPVGMTVDPAGEIFLTGYTLDLTFPVTTGAFQTVCSEATDPLLVNGKFRCGNRGGSVSSAFVTKLSPGGTSLVYSSYLHGYGGGESGQSIVVDALGDAYVLGATSSNDFPITTNAYQKLCQPGYYYYGFGNFAPTVSALCDTFANNVAGQYNVNGPTLFIAKLNPTGTSLLYSTFFGGSLNAYPSGIALDAANNIYFASAVDAAPPNEVYPNGDEVLQFPLTTSAYQSIGMNTIVPALSKLSADGQTLLYSTFLEPTSLTQGNFPANDVTIGAFTLGQNGIAYLGGATDSAAFPTTAGSLKPTCTTPANVPGECAPAMGWVAAIDATKSGAASLVYSSFLGGEQVGANNGGNPPLNQNVLGLTTDSSSNLYVTGNTIANDFPTTANAFQTACNPSTPGLCTSTAFLTKVNPSGSALVWSTYLGGLTQSAVSSGQAIALDTKGHIYLYGLSASGASDFPQVNPLQAYSVGDKIFISAFSSDATKLLFSTRLGTAPTSQNVYASPIPNGIAVDPSGNIYFAGYSNDSGTLISTPGTYSTTATGGYNRPFFGKISPVTSPSPSNGLTTNLLLNPGAELGSIADWTAGGGGTPTVDSGTFDPGINPHTGTYDFVGGANSNSDSLSQTVSIITQGITAAQVDGGTLFANISFWEQGLNKTPSDTGGVSLKFLDANGAAIGSTVNVGTEDSHDGTWANVTGIPAIPVGTRSITYTMNFTKHADTSNLDAFIDDNVLSIHTDTGLTISPNTLHFGNVGVGSQSAAQTATVTNQQATTTINISQIVSELGANPASFQQTNNCPAALAPGATCQVTITFVPTGVGPQSAGIAINTDSVPPLQQISVDGTGTGGILQVNPGNLKTVAGNGTAGDSGDGGQAILAQLNQPDGVAFDPSGNLYIADDQANVVRKVDTTGKITTFAGVGTGGFAGDGGLATQAELLIPFSVTSDKNGNIYIQDTGNYVIRKVDATTGIITTFAGTPGTPGHAGDGGPATAARFNQNQGARFDSAGNMFVPQCQGASIRRIDTAGNISTVAGNFTEGFSGDGGQATAAQLQCPSGVTIDAAGNLYIADEFNQVIRKVNTSGVISTIAGTPGTAGFSGDGGAATAATFNNPNDVVIDAGGNLYVADSANNRVRKIDVNGIITTAAGGLNSAGSAGVNTPLGVTVDTAGNVYFSDSGNSRIDEIFPQGTQPFPATVVGSTAPAETLTLSNIGNVDVTLAATGALTTSGNAGDFSVSPGTCAGGAVLTANGGTCAVSIAFTPTAVGQRTLTVSIADNALNSPQSFSIGGTGTVAAAITPTITWPNPANIQYGTALSSTQLDAVATGTGGVTVAGTFVYSPAAGTVPTAGTQTLVTAFLSSDPNYTNDTASVSITVTPFTPVLTWATPAPITTTTPLSATQLNAAATDINNATVPGVYAYTPAAGSLLSAGTQTLSVTFTPTDAVDFATVTKTVSIVVTSGSAAATTTTTTLAVSSGGSAATTVAAGSVVTLTATVNAGTAAVSPGQVAFCDASATRCTDSHLLATAQLVGTGAAAGTATYSFVPGLGAHSYRAMFLGTTGSTNSYAASASITTALAVTGTYSTATTIAQSGTAGNFTLNATTVGAGAYPSANPTQSVTINLGQSAQTYVLTGTGASTVNGASYGNYYNTQGSCVTTGATTTCDLTGAFTSTSAGFAAGTYDFQTVFTGSISSAVTSQTQYPVGQTEPNGFLYTAFAPSTTMTLKLNVAGGGAYSIPVAENGNLDPNLTGLGFADTAPVCGGTSLGTLPCQEDNVGTVVGATYTSPVTGSVQFQVPSPATLVGPTGTVSFVDTSNANAVLGTGVLGTATAGFALAQATGSPVAVGKGPYGVNTGDLNGDGFVDVVVANQTDDTIGVLLGNGDGTFKAQVTFAVGVRPVQVRLADLNGDGKLDLVVTTFSSNTILVLLGNGDGTFQPPVTYPCASPVGLAVMDINHDGIPDVVASDYNTNTMSVLLGNGDGTLKTAVTYPTGSVPQTLAEGDFNGDGNVDVVVGNEGGATVGIFLGNGDGTFKPMVTYAVGNGPQGVQVGDFNGDGYSDLAVSNHDDGTIGVLLGNGDGTFQSQVTYKVGQLPVGLAIADFNGDGIEDITVGNTGTSLTQGVLLGNGDGTFQPQVTFKAGDFPLGTTVADFNGDGLPDIVASNFNDGTVTIFLSQPTETAIASVTGIAPSAGSHAAVASYPGDANYGKSVSTATNLIVGGTAPVITWAAPANIVYGTALSATQLNATAAVAGVAIPGTFTYTPALGAILTAGTQTLSVVFTPTSTSYSAATASVAITVTPAAPVISWATPASIANGTALSATQLNATAAGLNGVALTGAFVYTPAAGTVLSAGTQTLSVAFTPTSANYAAATGSVKLVVTPLAATVAWATPASIAYGTALSGAQLDATATGLNGVALAGTFVYTPALGTVLNAGTQTLSVTFTPTNTNYAAGVGSVNLIVSAAAPTVTWSPPANIVYGTALSATQLDATATGVGGAAVAGTFVYTPAATTVLTAGTHTLSVAFTPTSANYLAGTGSTTIAVTQATPVITWAAPAGIAYGTPLSAAQLDATVAGVVAGALPGTLVYTPALGTVLTPGTQTLSVAFTPTDAVDYTAAAASVKIVVGGPTLLSLTPAQAVIGSANSTISLTGTGFVANSVVQANGTALATTFVNSTTLMAVVPATLLTTAGTLQIAVADPSIESSTAALAFTVLPIATSATLTGPSTTPPGSQPSVNLTITNPYPLALTAQFTLTFASVGSTPVDDPSIQFSTGGRSFSYVVAANSTSVPPVQLQAGTDAGTITITAKLTADGLDVTPTGLAPLVIVVPAVVPVLSGTTVTRTGDMLTVVVHGFSNTREVSSAVFDFMAATGDTVATPSLTIPATTIFGAWYGDATSLAYGSTFTYTQVFNTSGAASTVGPVKVTLTNSVGVSEASTGP